MTRAHALSLSDHQLQTVQMAARLLPAECRDWFLSSWSDRLAHNPLPDDAALERAIVATLKTVRIPVALSLQQPSRERPMSMKGFQHGQDPQEDHPARSVWLDRSRFTRRKRKPTASSRTAKRCGCRCT